MGISPSTKTRRSPSSSLLSGTPAAQVRLMQAKTWCTYLVFHLSTLRRVLFISLHYLLAFGSYGFAFAVGKNGKLNFESAKMFDLWCYQVMLIVALNFSENRISGTWCFSRKSEVMVAVALPL